MVSTDVFRNISSGDEVKVDITVSVYVKKNNGEELVSRVSTAEELEHPCVELLAKLISKTGSVSISRVILEALLDNINC